MKSLSISRSYVDAARVRAGRSGFTLIELLVVIAIIGLLAAILFPVFGMVRERARGTACLSNMRQICMGLTMYVGDKGERFPPYIVGEAAMVRTGDASYLQIKPGTDPPKVPSDIFALQCENLVNGAPPWNVPGVSRAHYVSWMDCIFPYINSLQVFTCPSHKSTPTKLEDVQWDGLDEAPEYFTLIDRGRFMYSSLGYNGTLSNLFPAGLPTTGVPVSMAEVKDPAQKIFAVHLRQPFSAVTAPQMFQQSEDAWLTQPGLTASKARNRKQWQKENWPHNDGSAMVFCDGHAKWVSRKSMGKWTCRVPNTRSAGWDDSADCGFWTPALPAPG